VFVLQLANGQDDNEVILDDLPTKLTGLTEVTTDYVFPGCWLLLQIEGALRIIAPEQHQIGNSESLREQNLGRS